MTFPLNISGHIFEAHVSLPNSFLQSPGIINITYCTQAQKESIIAKIRGITAEANIIHSDIPCTKEDSPKKFRIYFQIQNKNVYRDLLMSLGITQEQIDYEIKKDQELAKSQKV